MNTEKNIMNGIEEISDTKQNILNTSNIYQYYTQQYSVQLYILEYNLIKKLQ